MLCILKMDEEECDEMLIQRYLSTLLQGLKDEDLKNSRGCCAATVAAYSPSRPSQLLPTAVTKHCDRVDE